MFRCLKAWGSKCEDTKNNTYQCIRNINNKENKVVCRFQDDENFLEYYDLNKDPYQLNNIPQKDWKPEDRRWVRFALEELDNIQPSLDREFQFFRAIAIQMCHCRIFKNDLNVT